MRLLYQSGTENHLGRSGRPKTTSMENGFANMEKQIELFIMNFMRRRTQMAFYSTQIFRCRVETAARDEIDTKFCLYFRPVCRAQRQTFHS